MRRVGTVRLYPPYGTLASCRNDGLADRPKRDAGELQMRPGKGKADDRDRPQHRGDEMAEREPPAGEDEPDQVADDAEQTGAAVFPARDVIAIHGPGAERDQGVGGDIESRAGPGN